MEKKYLVPERQVCFLLNEYHLYEAAENSSYYSFYPSYNILSKTAQGQTPRFDKKKFEIYFSH